MNGRLFTVVLCFLFSAMGVQAQVVFDVINDAGIPIRYMVVSETDKTVAVTGGKKFYSKVLELSIPETINYNGITYTVTEIGEWAFTSSIAGCKIERVILPPTIKKIGAGAFDLCKQLSSINLPEGLVEIGAWAFWATPSLTKIYIPSSVKKIGDDAFHGSQSSGLSKKELENLPLFITTENCEKMGLSKESVNTYLAYHPRTTQPQQQIVYVPSPAQQAVEQPNNEAPQPKVPSSDVDIDIPQVTDVRKNTFAIIIANEDYQDETKVDYAKNDGEVFKNYCHKTFGLPEKNVHFVANATLNNLIGELDWLQQVCDAFSGEANVIFYYAGHGIPDEATSSAYLLPTDGNSRLLRTCFSINELYETLGKLPAKKVTVLMDACFSGAKRDGNMLASARGVAIKAKAGAPKGNMIVMSAAQGDETAYKYEDVGHGLFTYFLLKKLKETKGNVTMGELSHYLQEQVKRYSIVENGKSQTPSVHGNR